MIEETLQNYHYFTTVFMTCEPSPMNFIFLTNKKKKFCSALNEIFSAKQKNFLNFSSQLKNSKTFWINQNKALPPPEFLGTEAVFDYWIKGIKQTNKKTQPHMDHTLLILK